MKRNYLIICFLGMLLVLLGCIPRVDESGLDYRQEMRNFVQEISDWARENDSEFIIIPQNGHELLTRNGEPDGTVAQDYIHAINGVGREDFLYGYEEDNQPTPTEDYQWMKDFMDVAETQDVEVLITDYCWTEDYVDRSYNFNTVQGYISFAADERDLNNIPEYPVEPYQKNLTDVPTLADAKNFLYLLDSSNFDSKAAYLQAVEETNYDLLIINLFYEDELLTRNEIESLQLKADGGKRLVIAYMSIGEAEDYRYYWQSDWDVHPPSWLAAENSNWEGNYKVRYWEEEWQEVIYGNQQSYLQKILDAGFDGVYLDIIDAFEYFEAL